MILEITNLITNELFLREIHWIKTPIREVASCVARTANAANVDVILGDGFWKPIHLSAPDEVFNLISSCYPKCNLQYQINDNIYTLDTVYVGAEDFKLYFKHANVNTDD
jgi:hypothetical protein